METLSPAPTARRLIHQIILAAWILLLPLISPICHSEPLESALEPADTSSPRSTLLGFIRIMNSRYQSFYGEQGYLMTYLRSGSLFPTHELSRDTVESMMRERAIASKFLDMSTIPKAMLDQTAWRLSTQLKEVLDRIPLPPPSEVPDANAARSLLNGRWTIPESEIRIGLITEGAKAGQYLFTKETVEQIPLFFERIRNEPYLSKESIGLYDTVFGKPLGIALVFRQIFPPRWMMELPEWTQWPLLGEPLWRWIGLTAMTALAATILLGSHRLSKSLRWDHPLSTDLLRLLPTLTLLGLIPFFLFLAGEALRVPPGLFQFLNLFLWAVFYLALTFATLQASKLIAHWLIQHEKIQTDSTDSQLIRIASRILSLMACIGILIEGANRLGLPSYSIMAGLGVGGLAFALAGQHALGNLIGSLILMLEKPFRIGDQVKSGGYEGEVEGIGFRTTQIKTPEGTQVSIPSSELIRLPIENLSLRQNWRVRKTLMIDLETQEDKINRFREDIIALLERQGDTVAGSVHVDLWAITPRGIEILIDYKIDTRTVSVQIERTGRLLMEIRTLAEKLSIRFQKDDPCPISPHP